MPPDEQRKEVVEALGAPSSFFEKKFGRAQVSRRAEREADAARDGADHGNGPFLESLTRGRPKRDKKLNEHRKNAQEKLAKHLKEVLQPGQLDRLRQVTLQREGSFALGQEDVRNELKITQGANDAIHGRRAGHAKKVESLVKEAPSAGRADEIRPKIEQLRKGHGKKLLATMLTDSQQKQWKEQLAHRSSWGMIEALRGHNRNGGSLPSFQLLGTGGQARKRTTTHVAGLSKVPRRKSAACRDVHIRLRKTAHARIKSREP